METGNKFKYTTAYFKIRDLILNNPDEDVFVIRGGQGASKTISILQLIIQSLCNSTKEGAVVSSELSKMKRTVVKDYRKVARDWGVLDDLGFNKTESKHDYFNGSHLGFLGADVNDIGKGFRCDILYINEADKMDIETAVQFISRAGLTIIDYNPDSLFWGDEYINDNNFITLTFEDNEYLSASEVRSILDYKSKGFYNTELPFKPLFEDVNIKSKYWSNKWRVYGLGMVGDLDGVVFDNWKKVNAVPVNAQLLGAGMDFGFTNDPTTMVAVYRYNGQLIFDEMIYGKGLRNSDIANLAKGFRGQIYADSAEPKSISDLKSYGLKIIGADKGADSIRFGISLLQEDEFLVTSQSTNLIKELQSYIWQKDKTGTSTLKPIDAFNHCIDAMRYFAMMHLKKRKSSVKIRRRNR